MEDFFSKEHIFLNENINSRDEVLKFISDRAEDLGVGPSSEVYQAFLERERSASTGMQDGIAMPHAISAAISKSAVIYVKLTDSLTDWETFDDTKVNKIIAMLVPKNGEKRHLQILSNFAASLVDDEKRANLDKLDTVDEIYNFLNIMEVEE